MPRPRLGSSRDAVVRVTLGAICGSDLHIYHGNVPIEAGAVIGHEFVGVVEDTTLNEQLSTMSWPLSDGVTL